VHFVGFGFQPVEHAAHPIPAPFAPKLHGVRRRVVAVEDKILVRLRQFRIRAAHIHLAPGAGTQQIALALLAALRLEQFHRAVLEAQAAVRDGAFQVDADHPPESPACRARPERAVEAEQAGARRRDLHIAMRAMPAAGMRQNARGILEPGDERDLPLAKPQRRLHRLEQARAVLLRHGNAILYYPNHGGQTFGGEGGFVRA